MDEGLYSQFLNPNSEYRAKPFWSWNGKLEKEELIRQIHVMKQMGFGGFFMHSRTGLQTEYLGSEWFELINQCADEAEKLGMEAWLYDEDRWPSGTAGGMVTQNSEYRSKYIFLEVIDSKEFQWNENYITAFSCELNGINYYNSKRISRETPKSEYTGKSILTFRVVEPEKSTFYNGYTYVDTLNREATERFLELTHEKYKKFCGNRIGSSIKGIFTDEPHRGSLMDGFSLSETNARYYAPWTKKLFENFNEKYGYDLVEKLPELFLRNAGKVVSKVKWQYVELLQEMFIDNFARPINEWCKKNNLILTGHVLHEDSLTAQTAMNGSLMRYYEYMDYPGVDVLTEKNNNHWIVKQVASAAHQLGKKRVLSELYGATGWDINFEGYKAAGDWQTLFGINLRCPHLSWYTMEGEAKRDYPASILHQSSCWKEYKCVEDYFSRTGLLMSRGSNKCDVLVLNSVESLWCQIYAGWSKNLSAQSEEVQVLENKYKKIFKWLTVSHIDFDYGDEDILSRYCKVEKNDSDTIIRVVHATYKVIIVGGMLNMRPATLKIIEEFIKAGGKVIFLGQAPQYVEAEISKEVIYLSTKAIKIPFQKNKLIDCCKELINMDIEIMNSTNHKNIEEIFHKEKEEHNNFYFMLLNTNRERSYKSVLIRIKRKGFAEEWDCSTGKKYYVGKSNEHGFIDIQTDFLPGEEKIFVISNQEDNKLENRESFQCKKHIILEEQVEYELNEPNVYVLDMAAYKIDKGEWNEEKEILKVDRIIRKHYGLEYRNGQMIQPWFNNKGENKILGDIRLKFKFYIKQIPEKDVEIAMERPEHFNIKINNKKLSSEFNINNWWIDRCFKRINIPKEVLIAGENVIELEFQFYEGINIESLYLIGYFGVDLDGNKKIITLLPDKLAIGDLVKQKLPFYSGKVTYKFKPIINLKTYEKALLKINKFSASCINIKDENGKWHIAGWNPFEFDITNCLIKNREIQIQVVLSRRNTFGPLHQVPVVSDAYGPGNFVTENEGFSENYMLIPSGLLEGVQIILNEKIIRL